MALFSIPQRYLIPLSHAETHTHAIRLPEALRGVVLGVAVQKVRKLCLELIQDGLLLARLSNLVAKTQDA